MVVMNGTISLTEQARTESSRTSTYRFPGHLLAAVGVWGTGDVRPLTRGRDLVPPLGSSLIV